MCEFIDNDRASHDLLKRAAEPNEKEPLSRIKEWLIECGTDSSISFYSSALFNLVAKIMSGAVGTDDVRNRLNAMFAGRLRLVRQALTNAVSRGQLPADCNVDLTEEILTVFISGFIDHLRLGRGENIRKNYSVVVEGLIDAIGRH